MSTYIVLLRGVMPSGKNKVPMAQLREVLKRGGFGNVRTYVQSGNVLVDSGLSAQEIGKCVRELIKKHIGPDLAVVVRTGSELQKVLEENPFQQGYTISRVFFVVFAQIPTRREYKNFHLRTLAMKNLLLPGPETQHICTFQAPMAGADSGTIFWKRSSAFLQP